MIISEMTTKLSATSKDTFHSTYKGITMVGLKLNKLRVIMQFTFTQRSMAVGRL